MDQIRANTPGPIKANLSNEQLSVQMSWGNGGGTHAGFPRTKAIMTVLNPVVVEFISLLNSLGLIDAMWRHGSMRTLV